MNVRQSRKKFSSALVAFERRTFKEEFKNSKHLRNVHKQNSKKSHKLMSFSNGKNPIFLKLNYANGKYFSLHFKKETPVKHSFLGYNTPENTSRSRKKHTNNKYKKALKLKSENPNCTGDLNEWKIPILTFIHISK